MLPPAWTASISAADTRNCTRKPCRRTSRCEPPIAEFVASDAPVYAECGGFMYLTRAIVDMDGRIWPMAGIFPTSARMQERLPRLGYIEVETYEAAGWLAPGERATGTRVSLFRYRSDAGPIRSRYRLLAKAIECDLFSAATSICTLYLVRASPNGSLTIARGAGNQRLLDL